MFLFPFFLPSANGSGHNPLARHFFMQLNTAIVNNHQQLDNFSCIPMSVELVLKLIGRVPIDYYDLQREWQNRTDGSFAAFDGRVINGVRFRLQFSLQRDDKFPFEDLFRTIKEELAAGRFVIISLAVQGGWHMFVVFEMLPSGEFRAISKIPHRPGIIADGIRAIVQKMKGTDILTYNIEAETTPQSAPVGT